MPQRASPGPQSTPSTTTTSSGPVRRASIKRVKGSLIHEAQFEADEGRPYLEGFMDKYAQGFPYNWKTRYFELGYDNILRYYTTELHDPRREEKGVICITDAVVLSEHKNAPRKWFKGRENGISITSTSGRVLNLSAHSAAAQSKWLRVLAEAVDGITVSGSAPSPIPVSMAVGTDNVPAGPPPTTSPLSESSSSTHTHATASGPALEHDGGTAEPEPRAQRASSIALTMPGPPTPTPPTDSLPTPNTTTYNSGGAASGEAGNPPPGPPPFGSQPTLPSAHGTASPMLAIGEYSSHTSTCSNSTAVAATTSAPTVTPLDSDHTANPKAGGVRATNDYEVASVGGPVIAYDSTMYDVAMVGGPVTLQPESTTYDKAAPSGAPVDLHVGGEAPTLYNNASAVAPPVDVQRQESSGQPEYEIAEDSGAPPLGMSMNAVQRQATDQVEYEIAEDIGAPPLGMAAPPPPASELELSNVRQTTADEPAYAIATLPPDTEAFEMGSNPFLAATSNGTTPSTTVSTATCTPASVRASARIADWDEDDDTAEIEKQAKIAKQAVDARASFSARTRAETPNPIIPARKKKNRRESAPHPLSHRAQSTES
eukprot:m.122124 g.122124  ORF g.122124 m.122124 type:complete len:599 (-) comp21938_c0_seq2:136-1932(-)